MLRMIVYGLFNMISTPQNSDFVNLLMVNVLGYLKKIKSQITKVIPNPLNGRVKSSLI
jgi:hypothetical protein